MKTEKKIKIASLFLQIIMVLQIFLILALIFVYFHSTYYPELYKTLSITKNRNLVFNLNIEQIPKTYTEWKNSKQLFHYNLLTNYSKFYIIFTKIIPLTGYFLIIFLLKKFLSNTKNYDLFFISNIKLINKIVILIFILFVFHFLVKGTTFNPITMVFTETQEPHYITKQIADLNFLIYYPISIIFFLVLKEVFKRGQELKKENDLTI